MKALRKIFDSYKGCGMPSPNDLQQGAKRMFRTSQSHATLFPLPTITIQPIIRAITIQWGYKAWQFSPFCFNPKTYKQKRNVKN